MIIALDLSMPAKAALDRLLERGNFANASEVVGMALLSYEALHAATPGDVAALLQGGASHRKEPNRPERRGDALVPSLFQLQAPEQYSALQGGQTTPEPIQLDLPPQQWIWGQYNKLLPLKVTCRAVLNRLASQPGGVDPRLVAPAISQSAAEFAHVLRASDDERSSRREDALANAFPLDDQSGRSRIRFETQFVGEERAGEFVGLPAVYKFVTRDHATGLVTLTPEGIGFALMKNPVLDGQPSELGQRFGAEELDFLQRHIVRKVPSEVAAFVAIIRGISKGSDSPASLDKFLRKQYGLMSEKALTSTFLTTQRTGVISRMSELALLTRERVGVSVRYKVTPRAEQFLGEAGAQ